MNCTRRNIYRFKALPGVREDAGRAGSGFPALVSAPGDTEKAACRSGAPEDGLREQAGLWPEPWLIGSLRPLSQAPQEKRKGRSTFLFSQYRSRKAVVLANEESASLDDVCKGSLQGRKNKRTEAACSDCVQRLIFYLLHFAVLSGRRCAEWRALAGPVRRLQRG